MGSFVFEYGFEKQGNKWLHPEGTTGNPGISINKDGRYISSHGSDPLCDGHNHDKFDFIAQYQYEGDKSQLLSDIRQNRQACLDEGYDEQEWTSPKELKERTGASCPVRSQSIACGRTRLCHGLRCPYG